MRCNKCGKKVTRYANGKRCQDCYNDYMAEYMLRRYHERRAEVITVLGGKCAECGSEVNLQIDHVDWRLKRIGLNKLWSISRDRFLAELAKCQLLCENHHIEKSIVDLKEQRTERPWPVRRTLRGHGTEASWRRGCFCDLCRQAHEDGVIRRNGGTASVA